MDANIELAFLTGISKFSKVGISSGLNNLRDLTMDAQYATMLRLYLTENLPDLPLILGESKIDITR